MFTEIIWLLTPEIVLVAVAVSIYLAGAFVDSRESWSWIAGGGIILAAAALLLSGGVEASAGPITLDSLAHFGRWLALAVGALLLLLASRPLDTPGTPEYVGSLLLAIAGLMLVCSAGELVLLFVGLELISIPTYILLYLGRRDAASQEATVKYFFLSILASAMLLYGLSFLYGATGHTRLDQIGGELAGSALAAANDGALGKLAWVLIFAGLGFKIAAVPFHFYAPDVYQGTTNPNAGLLSVLPKAAGVVVLVRLAVVAMSALAGNAWPVVALLAILTMTFGNVMALWQENIRRLLAYSSIAHAGYMLIGLAVAMAPPTAQGRLDGLSGLLFYLCVYAVATLGAFAALEYLGRRDRQIEAVEELAGLGRTRPLLAVAMAVFMFSLAGIPPLAGFWGKLYIFGSAIGVDAGNLAEGTLWPWFVALAVVGVLNAAVAAAYYLRIVGVMYFRTPLAVLSPRGGAGAWLAMTACAVLVVAIGILPGPLYRQSDAAKPGSVAGPSGQRPSVAAELAEGDSGPGVQDSGL